MILDLAALMIIRLCSKMATPFLKCIKNDLNALMLDFKGEVSERSPVRIEKCDSSHRSGWGGIRDEWVTGTRQREGISSSTA